MSSDDFSDFHSASRRPGQSYELSSACLAHLCVVCIQLLCDNSHLSHINGELGRDCRKTPIPVICF